ncbi:MAG: DUF3038 domain-containing protein [Synechococcales cyanobacterium RM1_1_8]|nr:DUF3038 domain-containing protein [Synechococcales cyanobacterium RM1_1_8]
MAPSRLNPAQLSVVPAQDLPETTATPEQLDSIKAQLDLVLLALEAIANLGSEAMLQAAEDLQLSETISDRVSLWRLRQSSPLRKSSGGRKKLDIEEARALVLVSAHLAELHQTLIRQAVEQLEALTLQGKPPHAAALLGDYLDRFCNFYQERMAEAELPMAKLTDLALKLLIDLLFYGSSGGRRRLWLALLDRAQ